MTDKIPKVTKEESFSIFGVHVKAYVLDNGKRVIEKESMEKLFESMETPHDDIDEEGIRNLAKFIRGVK